MSSDNEPTAATVDSEPTAATVDSEPTAATVDSEPTAAASTLTLAEAADVLGVHYMTAYKYVRTGRLEAEKERGQWVVATAAIDSLVAGRTSRAGSETSDTLDTVSPRPDYPSMFRRRAVAGDESGAWSIVDQALSGGATPTSVHNDIIRPAMREVGELWAQGELSIAEEHVATSVVLRMLGRMTPLFRHPGRRRGPVVLGAVERDPHSLPSALLADMLCDRNFDVIDLGANTPIEAFIATVKNSSAVAVGVTCALDDLGPALTETARAIAGSCPSTMVVVGGGGAAAVREELDGIAEMPADIDGVLAQFERAASAAAHSSAT